MALRDYDKLSTKGDIGVEIGAETEPPKVLLVITNKGAELCFLKMGPLQARQLALFLLGNADRAQLHRADNVTDLGELDAQSDEA